MRKIIFTLIVLSSFSTNHLFAVTDTLRTYNPAAGTTTYSGYVLQVAYFVPLAPCSLKTVIVALGGPAGTATIHIYGHEGGNTVPQLEKDLVTPIVVNKADTGMVKIKVDLSTPLYLPNNHFFVGISDLTGGVTFLSDNEIKAEECISATGGTYHFQYFK